MLYLEQMQEALDDLYLEQKKIEAEYRRRKEQTETGVKLALLAWLASLGTDERGLLRRPTPAQVVALRRRINIRFRPIEVPRIKPPTLKPPTSDAAQRTRPGNLHSDINKMTGKAAAVMDGATETAAQVGIDPGRPPRIEMTKRGQRMQRDYDRNLEAVIFNGERKIDEVAWRWGAGSVTADQARSAARNFELPSGTFNLSTGTHPWAAVRGTIMDYGEKWHATYAAAAKKLGAKSPSVKYVVMAPSEVMEDLAPAGLTARHLYRSFTFAALLGVYVGLDITTSTPDTLGLHHNSREVYVPVVPPMIDEAEEWAKKKRAEFLEGVGK